MELNELRVDTYPSLTLPWEEILIAPIGDIQHGADGVDIPKLKRHMQWGVDYNCYFTGLGDYIDVASPSGRQKIRAAALYDSVEKSIDEHVIRLLDEVKRALEPSQGRWIGLSKGHHLWTFTKNAPPEYRGKDTDDVLAEFLGCPVSDEMGAMITQVKFRHEKYQGRRSMACQVWQWHGEGSGQTMAAPLNKLEKAMGRWQTVDIFLMGHYSRKCGYPVDCLVPVFGKKPHLKAVRRILACTGGFMRGYNVGPGTQASYVEKSGMNPTNLGGVLIKVRPVHTATEDRLDMNIEV